MAKHGGFAGGMPGMNMNNLMKQYQKMQRKMEEAQEELAKKEYTGQAGGGAVQIVITGERKVLSVKLDKDAGGSRGCRDLRGNDCFGNESGITRDRKGLRSGNG